MGAVAALIFLQESLPSISMALLPILQFPDKRLRIHAAAVAVVDDGVQTVLDNMFETMYANLGIGLAATQVDIHQQIVVIDISEDGDQPLVLINPVILDKNGSVAMNEGCLSVNGVRAPVSRYSYVKVHALNRSGLPFKLEANDLLAVCIQHEIDHLNGKLFVDHLSPLKQQRIRNKIEKNVRKLAEES